VVHAVGESVRGFRVGDRVAVPSNTSCGQCENCQRGFAGHCGGVEWGGYTSGISRDGSLAEYFTVPFADYNCALIPDSVGDESALCATDTLLSGTTGPELAHIPPGGAVAVFGQGHVGLAAVAGAKLFGAGLVIAIKARAGAIDAASALGADVQLNLEQHDVVAEVRRLTGGVGVDCAVEATGVRDSFPTAVTVTRLGGTIAVLSSYSGPEGATLPIPLASWGWGIGDKTIIGTMQRAGGARLGCLLQLIASGRLDPAPLITNRYMFDQVESAFADIANRKAGLIKPVITF
jgi:threonine dehydrogenase-like Zn-dependent dehydrogenase